MDSLWHKVIWGNKVQDWLTAACIIIVSITIVRILQSVVLGRVKKFAARTSSTLDDVLIRIIQRNVMPLAYFIAVIAGLRYLVLPPRLDKAIDGASIIFFTYFLIRGISNLLTYFFAEYTRKSEAQARQAKGIIAIVKVILWLLGIILMIDNLGYNITAIVTGLGIGGVAIALAAQAVLADLFSYLVIFFDKPFETGDFIALGDKSGAVEYIGVKTTRLRTADGEQLVVSNTDLTNSRVHNYKRMEKRRVLLTIGVTYETPPEKLRRIPAMIKEIVESQQDVLFERAHFKSFGAFSLDFEIVYHILTPDYGKFMDCQQAFGFALIERMQAEEIEFAYPTQKLITSPEQQEEPSHKPDARFP
jgi:small-conductance mechanosensitive channel